MEKGWRPAGMSRPTSPGQRMHVELNGFAQLQREEPGEGDAMAPLPLFGGT